MPSNRAINYLAFNTSKNGQFSKPAITRLSLSAKHTLNDLQRLRQPQTLKHLSTSAHHYHLLLPLRISSPPSSPPQTFYANSFIYRWSRSWWVSPTIGPTSPPYYDDPPSYHIHPHYRHQSIGAATAAPKAKAAAKSRAAPKANPAPKPPLDPNKATHRKIKGVPVWHWRVLRVALGLDPQADRYRSEHPSPKLEKNCLPAQ
jgi:hypothetical protein